MPNYMDEKIKKKKRLAEQEAGEPKPVEPEEEKIPEIFPAEKKTGKEQKIFKKPAEEPKPPQKAGAGETLTQGQVEEAREQEKDNRKKKLVTSYGNAKIYT